jgi:hypothetical protein
LLPAVTLAAAGFEGDAAGQVVKDGAGAEGGDVLLLLQLLLHILHLLQLMLNTVHHTGD